MSDRITSAIYKWVVDDVMVKCKPEFVTEGVDESVLVQLRALWEAKLVSTGLVVDPAATPAPLAVQATPTPVFQPYGYTASVKPEPGTWPRVAAPQQQMTHPSQGVAAALGYAQQTAATQQQQLQLRLQMQQQAAHLQAQQHMQQQQQLAMQQLAASMRLPKPEGSSATPPMNNLLPGNGGSELDATRKRKQPDVPNALNPNLAWGAGLSASSAPFQQQQAVQQQLLQLQQLQQQQLQQSYAQSRAQQGLVWPNPVATIPAPALLSSLNPTPLLQQRQQLSQQQPQPNLGNSAAGTMPMGSSSNPGVIPQHDGPGDVPHTGGGAGPSKPSAPRKAAAPAAGGASGHSSKATPEAAAAPAAASAAAEQGGTEELLSSDDEGSVEEEEVSNFLCGQFEKVTRAKHKWKITMKDGVFHADGKDYLFKRGTAEFMWTG